MNEQALQQRYLNIREAAKYIGFKASTVHRWLLDGKLPGHKVGRLWRLDVDELDNFVHGIFVGTDTP